VFLNPAEYVIYCFRGVCATARALKRDHSSVSRWPKPKAERGCEGEIPRAVRRDILEIAARDGLDITPHDLDFGREIPGRDQRLPK